MRAVSPLADLAHLHALNVARIEKLRAETDAWRLLIELGAERRWGSRVAAHGRVMQHYGDFVRLTAQYPASDQDALLSAARHVFGVRMRTLRADLARAVQARS